MKRTYMYELCEGRHNSPAKEGIFPRVVDKKLIGDPIRLKNIADDRIPKDCGRLVIFVTGLTVAMLAVVSVCVERNIKLTCYHQDPVTKLYDRQNVIL